MEHLETQVSDLRSFLPGAPTSSSSAASTSTPNANSRPAAQNMAGAGGVGPGPGAATATTPRHPSQSAGSSVSAIGSNSAHPSPLNFGPRPNHNAQPARSLASSVSTPGAAHVGGGGAAAAAAAAGVKRKLNDIAPDDAAQRQQRSKRNRVSRCLPTLTLIIIPSPRGTWSWKDHLTANRCFCHRP